VLTQLSLEQVGVLELRVVEQAHEAGTEEVIRQSVLLLLLTRK